MMTNRRHRFMTWLKISGNRYDVLIEDSKSLETIQRHRIRTSTCRRPLFTGIDISKLRWNGNQIVGYPRDDEEDFRLNAALPTKHTF